MFCGFLSGILDFWMYFGVLGAFGCFWVGLVWVFWVFDCNIEEILRFWDLAVLMLW